MRRNRFHKNRLRPDGLGVQCKDCRRSEYLRNRDRYIASIVRSKKARRKAIRQFVLDYLTVHGCVDCGETDPVVMDFDHVRGMKRIEVSRLVGAGYSLEAVKAEIAKCDVRCSNCHRKATVRRRVMLTGK